jgi:peptidoglycan hydrolase FlgJ
MSAPTVAPSFYADFQGLDRLRASAARQDPAALREAARQFEGLFTAMMLKSMREASLGSGMGDSEETKTYQDMYDQQLALQLAHGKGLGLANMLMQQLTRAQAAHSTAASAGAATGSTSPATPASTAGDDRISSAQRADFVRAIEPLAQSAGSSLGVAPDTLIAQAALETGWGRNMPADSSGRSSSNLFGVKAGDSWRGAAVEATTTEYDQGTPVSTRAAFRSYGDAAQSVGDYVSLLRGSPRYAGALGAGSDVQAFGAGLQRGGYATDPDYVNKLVATVATLRQLRAAALKS